MTYKETDFPGLLRYLKTVATEESDPFLLKQVVLQLVKLYDEVPVYPGIVNMCLGKVVKTVPAADVEVGQKIHVKNREDCYTGIVASKDEDGVTLKQVRQIVTEDELELEFGEMEKVSVINDRALEELWPSLVFPKEKGI
ncbi:MAG TPA: hypothetical protein PLU72_13235 [Candidatus Ozemobacteraceae bacterium]|nr:hypothetical protein [Candidatus Ozemobacteraceae bacterium]HQG28256.1 hypothetical protein [Candidatus Ozemobacteraceae bacterium]